MIKVEDEGDFDDIIISDISRIVVFDLLPDCFDIIAGLYVCTLGKL